MKKIFFLLFFIEPHSLLLVIGTILFVLFLAIAIVLYGICKRNSVPDIDALITESDTLIFREEIARFSIKLRFWIRILELRRDGFVAYPDTFDLAENEFLLAQVQQLLFKSKEAFKKSGLINRKLLHLGHGLKPI